MKEWDGTRSEELGLGDMIMLEKMRGGRGLHLTHGPLCAYGIRLYLLRASSTSIMCRGP